MLKKKNASNKIQLSSLINEFYVDFFIFLLLIKFQLNICQYLFISKIFFLSYSFIMFRIDFLLSIWVNLHIYIDIVFIGLVFGLKFLLIIFFFIVHGR